MKTKTPLDFQSKEIIIMKKLKEFFNKNMVSIMYSMMYLSDNVNYEVVEAMHK